jgi:hypothetical protein
MQAKSVEQESSLTLSLVMRVSATSSGVQLKLFHFFELRKRLQHHGSKPSHSSWFVNEHNEKIQNHVECHGVYDNLKVNFRPSKFTRILFWQPEEKAQTSIPKRNKSIQNLAALAKRNT